jgi:hypothetical protein
MTDQETMMKSSKTSLLFAQAHNIERFKGVTKVNPSEFTPEELQAFEDFKRQKKEERMHAHYEKRKSEGTLTQKTATADMSEEQLQHVRDIKRRNALRLNYRKRHPNNSKEEIEAMVQKYIDDHPREGDDKMRSGPAQGSTMSTKRKATTGPEEQRPAVRQAQPNQGPRPKGKRSGVNYLELFLQENPEVAKVARPSELPEDVMRLYQRFRTNYNGRMRYAENPDKVCEQKKEDRRADPHRVRAIEANYRQRKASLAGSENPDTLSF